MEKPQHPFTTNWYSKLSYDMRTIALQVYFDELHAFNEAQTKQKLNIHGVMQGLLSKCPHCHGAGLDPEIPNYDNPQNSSPTVGNSAGR